MYRYFTSPWREGLQLIYHTQGPLPTYPESVPQAGPDQGRYEHRDAYFWTCGFFPGSIYALLERAIKFPAHFGVPGWYREAANADLLHCGKHWSIALNEMSGRTDTHDMGFIVQPALQKDWELTGNMQSRRSVINAAHALASRFDPSVGAIRSWDEAINARYSIVDKDDNFLVIIDSMCNLDLLYYVAHLTHDPRLAHIATTHAHTVRTAILRDDFSSFHMVNFDPRSPKSGTIKARMTNQGYRDTSTWSRGQAWAILGFAQTYLWTRDTVFLDTATACANMLLTKLVASKHHHPLVPPWDLDAPHADPDEPLRDTSAGVIAANGLLLIHQACQGLSSGPGTKSSCSPLGAAAAAAAPPPLPMPAGTTDRIPHDFLDAALQIVRQTLDMSLDRDFASLKPLPAGVEQQSLGENRDSDSKSDSDRPDSDSGSASLQATVVPSGFDAILRNATANNNEHAHKRYRDHGLVYADYYLLEFGNKLCRMGLC